MKKSNPLQMVCLDFDGVILESAIVKKDAYRKLFEVFVDHREQIEAYQAENGGLPRRRQFVEIFDQIMGQPLKAEQVDDLERRYVGLMLEGVVQAPFVEGAETFIRDFSQRTDLYVVSATPEDELLHIVQSRGLEPFFQDIWGSPMTKMEILQTLCRKKRVHPAEAVFVGDYPTDREAAEAIGMPFIARLGSVPEMEACAFKIQDLRELPGLLKEMFSLPES